MSAIQLTGFLAIIGAILYAIGDVLLLAGKIKIDDYPKLKPFQKLLSDAEKMVILPSEKMMWGALLGVFSTPLILAGFWQIYQGLAGANETLRLMTGILFSIAGVIGAFVHGSFFYMGEYVKALNLVNEDSQQVIADMITRHCKLLIVTYAPLLVLVIIASIFFIRETLPAEQRGKSTVTVGQRYKKVLTDRIFVGMVLVALINWLLGLDRLFMPSVACVLFGTAFSMMGALMGRIWFAVAAAFALAALGMTQVPDQAFNLLGAVWFAAQFGGGFALHRARLRRLAAGGAGARLV